MDSGRVYIAIDLKSFFASVECVKRGLDPLKTNLVVADISRTEKTICLAVSPSLKAFGLPGRARLFEVVQKVKEINRERKRRAPGYKLEGKSHQAEEVAQNPSLELDYITARPEMQSYMDFSSRIYKIYLKYVAPEDIHVYSIDEVFMDVTSYLKMYQTTPKELAKKMVQDVFQETGITATAGIGTNLYLCKVAMDIMAKHTPADEDGVRIAMLDEATYRRELWTHRPLTDFWRVGKGYMNKLESKGIYTMGDIARCSIGRQSDRYNEEVLYKLFGVNAELLIDHAWGYEPCTIKEIKNYRSSTNSISSGQVLSSGTPFEQGKLIIQEMADLLSLDLVAKNLVTNQMVITVDYDSENLKDPERQKKYFGEITLDRYGKQVPKAAHGSIKLGKMTSSTKIIMDAVGELFERIVDKNLLIRRMYVVASNIIDENAVEDHTFDQIDLFTDLQALQKKAAEELAISEKEKRMQKAMISIKKKFGKNSMLKGMNFVEGAKTIERNKQIGGHRA